MVNDTSSVHNEQFDGNNNSIENKEVNANVDNSPVNHKKQELDEENNELNKEEIKADNQLDPDKKEAREEDKVTTDNTASGSVIVDPVSEEGDYTVVPDESASDHNVSEQTAEESITDNKRVDEGHQDETKEVVPEKAGIDEKVEKPDYSKMDRKHLVHTLDNLLLSENIEFINDDVESIKLYFYKLYKSDNDKLKTRFIDEGGRLEDFKPIQDELEVKLKSLLTKYKDLKSDINRKLEEDKMSNLEKKYQVIEEIKELVNRKESINKTFQEFRELQQQWRDIGLVPQQNVKDLWESYHLACEMFYDYIKINKELRDLDLKKNLEAKVALCEKAEKLVLETSVVNAFKTLQNLHEQWREIGPVPIDKKAEIWERFKEITSKVNKQHHQYFENLKDNQKKNLEEKTALCEKVEELGSLIIESAKEWEEKSKEIIEIQKIWKTIGFAPKKDNNKIYSRFPEACDSFFNKKRQFFAENKEEQKNNLQLKTDLCVQAETLKESTDWKNTTEELIHLQKRWKEIGPVPKKYSDQIWERFRSACDYFFEQKSKFFSNIDNSYDSNLKMKQELITEIEKYELLPDIEENFENINKFQKRWTEIGFVPIQNKEEIQNKYRNAINNLFDKLKMDDEKRFTLKFNNKLNDIISKPNAPQKIRMERDKLIKKLTALENDIVVWENNIGFFSNSKNADSLIKDVREKIENGKKTVELLKNKIRAIDSFRDEKNID